MAGLVAPQVGADHLIVRQLDLMHGGLDTIAVGACRPDAPAVAAGRTDLTGSAIQGLLAWSRDASAISGSVPGSDPILAMVSPPGFKGECLAAPLHAEDGPVGVVLLVSGRARFRSSDRALLERVREPIAVALANTARLREFKRLRESLEADRQALLKKLGRHDVADAVVGAETGLRAVMDQVEHVAATELPVLIIGETGSGKEVLARALHERSRRASAPIVRVNCGAIPPGLVDSELFGHQRGSFPGSADRQGSFERANGGTLFLDEISELPLEAQVRLLRVSQDGSFERAGGQRPMPVDVRLVAATHRDLREMVARGTFSEDLWHRISVFPIHLPPLRERREDIPRLAAHFAARAATRLIGVPLLPTAEDLDLLLAYDWPGNVRELAAVIERAAILGAGRSLRIAAALGTASSGAGAASTESQLAREGVSRTDTLDVAMRHHIELTLQATGGRVEGTHGAARRLKINPHTLRARMKKLGIVSKLFRGSRADQRPSGDQVISLDDAMTAHIKRTLQLTGGRIEGPHGAARRLDINPHTLRARMRKLGISAAEFRTRARGSISAG